MQSDKTIQEALAASITPHATGRGIDLVFCFDATASMSSCIAQVKSTIQGMVHRLLTEVPRIRISILAHGDYDTAFDVTALDFSTDEAELIKFVTGVAPTPGYTVPECYELALQRATRLSWSAHSTKALVMIGDSVPHPPSFTDQHIYWRDELAKLVAGGVVVYGVCACTSADAFYRELAELSGGVFLQLDSLRHISDMFMAVCFREVGPEKLASYCVERMPETAKDAGLNALLTNLKQGNEKKVMHTSRVLKEAWFDKALDTATRPEFVLDAASNKFKTASSTSSPTSVLPKPAKVKAKPKPKKSKSPSLAVKPAITKEKKTRKTRTTKAALKASLPTTPVETKKDEEKEKEKEKKEVETPKKSKRLTRKASSTTTTRKKSTRVAKPTPATYSQPKGERFSERVKRARAVSVMRARRLCATKEHDTPQLQQVLQEAKLVLRRRKLALRKRMRATKQAMTRLNTMDTTMTEAILFLNN